MILKDRLLAAFPEPMPFTDRAIDEALLVELLPDKPNRLKHIMGVAAKACGLSARLDASPASARQIELAALAHDIGYAEALRHTGFHPLDGAIFLAQRDEPADLIHAVLHHSGAREGARAVATAAPFYADLPPFKADCLYDAITWCDTQTSPVGEPVTIEERIAEVEARYGVTSPTALAMRAMEPEFLSVQQRVLALISTSSTKAG